MVVDGGCCRDLVGHAGRDRISPVIYVWPSRPILVQCRTASMSRGEPLFRSSFGVDPHGLSCSQKSLNSFCFRTRHLDDLERWAIFQIAANFRSATTVQATVVGTKKSCYLFAEPILKLRFVLRVRINASNYYALGTGIHSRVRNERGVCHVVKFNRYMHHSGECCCVLDATTEPLAGNLPLTNDPHR